MWLFLLACNPGPDPVPDVVAVHDTMPIAEQIAARAADDWDPTKLGPGWIPTVYFYGWDRMYAVTGDASQLDYVTSWIDTELPDYEADPPRAFHASDDMALSSIASSLMIHDPTLDYTAITDNADAYLADVGRTDNGAIWHWNNDTAFTPTHQVWVDSQFMFGLYLVREWQRTGDTAQHDLFVEQYLAFSELCRDPDAQLYRHAWDDEAKVNVPSEAVFWARGNSWVLLAAAEYIEAAESPDQRVVDAFVAHADAAAALHDGGMWHTVMNSPQGDDPANYTETSASALIGLALLKGTRAGVLDSAIHGPVISAVATALPTTISDTDKLMGTSGGTNPGDYDYYVSITQIDDFILGLGPVMAYMAEVDGEPIR